MPARPTKDRIISYLLADPNLTLVKVAEIAGVSKQTVLNAKKRLMAEDGEANEGRLERYQKQLRERIPLKDRVERYHWLMTQKKQPMVALKALERIDSIDGIVTAREAKEKPETEKPQPMFVLPPGAQVSMTIPRHVAKTIDIDSTEVDEEPEVVDNKRLPDPNVV